MVVCLVLSFDNVLEVLVEDTGIPYGAILMFIVQIYSKYYFKMSNFALFFKSKIEEIFSSVVHKLN